MDVLTHLTAQVEELQERYFLSDEEVIRMIVGGSLVASIILGIAYMVYITNFTIVLSYIRSKILVSLVPKITKENAFIPIIVYVQVFIFVVSCLFFRRVKTIHMLDNYGPAISSGQVYRFFTSALVHSDLFSLFNNARAFGSIGGLLEQSIGIKVVILFLASNTIHAVISFLINPLDHSFGGHGVAFAFIGAAMYINFFRSSLFIHGEQKAQERKDQAQDLIRDESLIFFARYVLIGVFMDRMDLMTSVLSLIVGFITCMALCGDLAGNKTRTVVAVYVVITSLLIGYTQLYEIQNLDAELKKLQVCYKVSSEKSSVFFSDSYVDSSDYYAKRNYAYDVQRYVLPMWDYCLESVHRVQAKNYTLVRSQKDLLSSYEKIFRSKKAVMSFYSQTFQEEQADILKRVTEQKTDALLDLNKKEAVHINDALELVDSSSAVSRFAILFKIWNGAVVLFMLALLFVRIFPNHSVSLLVFAKWDHAMLHLIKFFAKGPLSVKAKPVEAKM